MMDRLLFSGDALCFSGNPWPLS